MTDFIFRDHGSIITLLPNSSATESWAEEHLPKDAMRWEGFVIEPRYIGPILDGIQRDGLTVGQ